MQGCALQLWGSAVRLATHPTLKCRVGIRARRSPAILWRTPPMIGGRHPQSGYNQKSGAGHVWVLQIQTLIPQKRSGQTSRKRG